jgi:protein SCO1/2
MVVGLDKDSSSIVISFEAIPGYMDAMEMPFKVRSVAVLEGLHPGTSIHFNMVETGSQFFAEDIQVARNVNGEAEPAEAARLGFVRRTINPTSTRKEVVTGQQVPDFTLMDLEQRQVYLSQFKGKVIILTFGYARCPNPNYCFRLSNNLAQLHRRFSGPNSNELMLVTVLIDPANDRSEALRNYAKAWEVDPASWRFLTGEVEQVRGVAALFGMDFWDDEGFLTHPFRTAVIDRTGRLVANLEGNQFTANQLGDLVESVLREGPQGNHHPKQ